MVDFWSFDYLFPIALPIVIAIIIAIFAFREERKILRMTRATARSLINEKEAMMYEYANKVEGWTDGGVVNIITSRIESDLEAVGKIAEFAGEGQEGRMRKAVELLKSRMQPKFPDQASVVNSAFKGIKWPSKHYSRLREATSYSSLVNRADNQSYTRYRTKTIQTSLSH